MFSKGYQVVSTMDSTKEEILDELYECTYQLNRTLYKLEQVQDQLWYIEDKIKQKNQISTKIKGDNNMDKNKLNLGKIFGKFGKIEKGELALTFDGKIAVKRNEGEYVRYNEETETMENQMNMVITEASDLIYIIPTNEIQKGDVIKNKETYYQILSINDNGSLKTVSIKNGTKKTILKETNILGLNFYYKVISLFTNNGNDNPTMQGIDPTMLMLLDSDENDDSLLPLLMMNNQQNNNASGNNINPMMFMMMGNNKEGKMDIKELLMMQMMMGQNNTQGINPMMLMAMKDGEINMKTLLMMNMMNNQQNTQNQKRG